MNIDSLCTQNHQELFESNYFTEQYIMLTRTEEGHEKD